MQNNLNRRHFLSAVTAGVSILPFLGLSGCRQEKEKPSEKKLFTNPKLELLDLALQHEYGAIVQYSNHAGTIAALTDKVDKTILEQFEQIIFDEVQHAVTLSKILMNNKVTPTISVWPPQTATNAVDMLQKDILSEEGAIQLYEQISTLDLSDDERQIIEMIGNAEVYHQETFSEIKDLLS